MLDLLEKAEKPLSVGEIAKLMNDSPYKISKDLNKMLQYNEIDFKEVSTKVAMKKYKCKHRMKIYYIKGMFLATVDLVTKKIFGCKEGSRTWWHEKGHIQFADTDWGSRISYWQIFFMMLAVFFGCLSLLIDSNSIKVFAFINALGMILCYIYEELWAWGWALKQYNIGK